MAAGPGLHSRIVAVLKVGLPLIALGLLAALFLSPGEQTIGDGVIFSEGDVEDFGNGLRITNPTFTGTTRGGDRFRFTAELIVPDAAPPERASITEPRGTLELAGGPVVTVAAETGELDLPSERIDLAGDVLIVTSDGYRMETDKATLDIRNGALIAGDQVLTTGPLGNIASGSLHVAPAAATGEARRFSFGNGVRLLYDPPDQ
jgi:lipopolysaccharide export system protein LptC